MTRGRARATPGGGDAVPSVGLAADGVDALATVVSALRRQVSALDERVARLEALAAAQGEDAEDARPAAALPTGDVETGRWLTLAGRTLIGLAGGYLLRAATGSGLVPGPLGAALGLAYAGAWMAGAFRAGARGRPVSAVLCGATAVLVAYPMLWESATRFGALPPRLALAAAVAFAVAGVVTALGHEQPALAGGHVAGAALLALALLARTHDVAAGVLALGVLHAHAETRAAVAPFLRWMTWVPLVLCLVVALHLAGRTGSEADVALVLAACAASALVAARRAARGTMTGFDAAQLTAALAIGGVGVLDPARRALFWAGAAVACTWGSRRAAVLRWPAALLTTAALGDAGLFTAWAHLMAGSSAAVRASTGLAAAGAAVLGWVLLPRTASPIARLPAALLAGLGLIGLAAGLVTRPPALGAAFGTVLLSAAAVACLALAARAGRVEAGWAAIALLVAGGLKLVVVDLPGGRPGPVFLSLVAYGAALLAGPSLRRA